MTWDWKHWLINCSKCGWTARFEPPDQKFYPSMGNEIRKDKCPRCEGKLSATWQG